MKKYIIYIAAFVLAGSVSRAQDFHLSQYDVGSLYLNPALTGMYGDDKGDYKVYVDSRSQWRAFGVKPFFTTYIAYDMPYTIKDKKVGFGAYFINNRTGPGNFNTTGFMLSGAYNILDKKANGVHYLTTGLQLGMFYKSFNNNLTYDAQYDPTNNGGSFDQNIASGENTNSLNITRFDANFGLYYKYLEKGKKAHPYLGFSMAHLTRSNTSFVGTVDRIPFKYVVNGGCDILAHEKFTVTPRFYYANQAKAYEVNVGVMMAYSLADDFSVKTDNWKILGGVDWRYKDAAVFNLGVKNDSYMLRFSYDLNTSYLKNYTHSRGAWEISLVYTGEKGKSFVNSIRKKY
jgi:type IX secretion system PorP/SprF family membrane protein